MWALAEMAIALSAGAAPGSSHDGAGWAAMRQGVPERKARTRGQFPSLDPQAERDAALAVVRAGRYADSSQAGVESHRRFVATNVGQVGITPYPPSVDKVEMVVVAFKAGNSRSDDNYLGQYLADSERAGFDLGDPIRRAFKDMIRSCDRGIGPGAKSKGLPMYRLHELPRQWQPWSPGGPICPRNANRCGIVVPNPRSGAGYVSDVSRTSHRGYRPLPGYHVLVAPSQQVRSAG